MALSWAQIKKLREDRAKLVEEGNKLLKAASDESRDLKAEEETRFDEIHADAEKLRKQIEREEQQFYAERSLSEPRDDVRSDSDPTAEPAGTGQPGGDAAPNSRTLRRRGRGSA